MPVSRQRRLAMAQRRHQVAELRLQGWTQAAIAAEKRVEQQPGDPRFLEQVQRCLAARRALLGLDAPPAHRAHVARR